jgi:hypothetical protein
MIWYLSTNMSQPIDNRAANSNTAVSLTPCFRTHVDQNWYLGCGGSSRHQYPAYDYQVIGGIMKAY